MSDIRATIAQRIAGLRDAAGLTPDSVAEAVGLTPEAYLEIESGKADASMSLLALLAAFYKIDTTALLTGGDAHAITFHVTRKGTGPAVARRSMYQYEALGAGFSGTSFDTFIVKVEPSLTKTSLNTHPGQEFNYVLAGSLQITIGENRVTVETGDSIHFRADVPHGMRALNSAPATFMAVITV